MIICKHPRALVRRYKPPCEGRRHYCEQCGENVTALVMEFHKKALALDLAYERTVNVLRKVVLARKERLWLDTLKGYANGRHSSHSS